VEESVRGRGMDEEGLVSSFDADVVLFFSVGAHVCVDDSRKRMRFGSDGAGGSKSVFSRRSFRPEESKKK